MLTNITPATETVVSLSEMRNFLRITDDAQDSVIAGGINSAILYIERYTNRCLSNQTWEQTFTDFDNIELRFSPIVSITTIRFFDTNGGDQLLSSDNYELCNDEPRSIRFKYNKQPPACDMRVDGIRVRYVAGYSSATCPETLKIVVKILATYFFENRQGKDFPSSTIDALLLPYRVTYVV